MTRKALVQLHRTMVPIRALPAALAGMRIIHLSDLHLSTWTKVAEETRRLLGTVDYDLLLVTGDFSHHPPHWQKTLDLMARFFDPIASVAPIYAVLGNHDLPQVAEHHQTPIRFLRNESTIVEFNGACIRLAGVEQPYGLLPGSDQALRDLHATLANPADDLCAADHGAADHGASRYIPTILLAHFPSTIYRLAGAASQRPDDVAQRPSAAVAPRPPAVTSDLPGMPGQGQPGYANQSRWAADTVDLVLSGHTHGGQIRLPGLGCIWANDAIPLRFARGLHRVGDSLLHTSAGIGVSGPLRLRFNCPAELTLLSLQPERFTGPGLSEVARAPRPPRTLIRV